MDKIQKIQEQIAALQKEADQLIAQQRADAIDAIKSQIKTYGLTAKDLGLLENLPLASVWLCRSSIV